MKRNFSTVSLIFGCLVLAGLFRQSADAAAIYQEENYGAAWRSFSVYSPSASPAVNTYSMKFATGIQVSGDRVQLVDNRGKFVRNGLSQPITPASYQKVDLRIREKPQVRGSNNRHMFARTNSVKPTKRVKVPVIGHAGRFVGKLFGKSKRKFA